MSARFATTLVSAGLAVATLAACGSGAAGGAGSSAASAPTAATSPAAPPRTAAPATTNAVAGSVVAPPSTTTPSDPPSPASSTARVPATFAGFVGTWEGHGRRLVVTSDGTVTLTFRTYRDCSATVTTGCDRTTQHTIIDGGRVRGHISSVTNATTVRVTVSSTSVPADFPASPFTLGHDLTHHALAAFVETGSTSFSNAPFCGKDAPSGYCGA